jgi:hypothetical protein
VNALLEYSKKPSLINKIMFVGVLHAGEQIQRIRPTIAREAAAIPLSVLHDFVLMHQHVDHMPEYEDGAVETDAFWEEYDRRMAAWLAGWPIPEGEADDPYPCRAVAEAWPEEDTWLGRLYQRLFVRLVLGDDWIRPSEEQS